MEYKEFMIEQKYKEVESKEDIAALMQWLSTLDYIGKNPRGMKSSKEALIGIQNSYDKMLQFNLHTDENQLNILNYYISKLDVDKVNLKFGKANDTQPSIIKKKYATYIKSDSTAYSRFLKEIKDLESFLDSLTGYHKKALGGLTIKFVSSKQQGSIAKYITKDDIIQINLKKVGRTNEEYGSLRYIVLHELGHRYVKLFRQNWNIDSIEWITTKYSTVDSWNGEEKFAELFAISHWESKYSEYSDKIERFKKQIK